MIRVGKEFVLFTERLRTTGKPEFHFLGRRLHIIIVDKHHLAHVVSIGEEEHFHLRRIAYETA